MRCLRLLPLVFAALVFTVSAEAKEITFQPPGQDGIDKVKEAQRKYDQARRRLRSLRESSQHLREGLERSLGAAFPDTPAGEVPSEAEFKARARWAALTEAEAGAQYQQYLAYLAALERTQEAEEELRRLANEAIKIADEVYKITPPQGLEGEPGYSLYSFLLLLRRGHWEVMLGWRALTSPDGTLSPSWLAANKIIAFTHVQQAWDGRRHVNTPRGASEAWEGQERAINRVEAYDAALKFGEALGLSETEIEALRKARSRAFEKLTQKNKQRIAVEGDYTTEPKDTDPEGQPLVIPPSEIPNVVAPIPIVPDSGAPRSAPPPSESGGVRFQFSGNGTTFGADLHLKNENNEARIINVLPGTFLHGADNKTQVLVTTPIPPIVIGPNREGFVRVPALCTDRDKKPPKVGEPLIPGIIPVFPSEDLSPTPGSAPVDLTDQEFRVFLTPEIEKHDPPDEKQILRIIHTGIAIENHLNRNRLRVFVTPTEDAPGPFEQANPPAGADAVTPDGGEAKSLSEVLKDVALNPPGPGPDIIRVFDPETSGWGNRVVLVPGKKAGAEATPQPTFNDTLRVQTMWSVTDNDGQPDREHIENETFKQFKSQGVSDEAARQAAKQVAKEIGDAAEEILEEAQDLEKEPQISFKINATLKGLPDAQ